jgi:hypothetical protein
MVLVKIKQGIRIISTIGDCAIPIKYLENSKVLFLTEGSKAPISVNKKEAKRRTR